MRRVTTVPNDLRMRQSGVSLVEILVAMAIAMFLMIGLAAVFSNSARTSSELNHSLQQIENGRFAVQTLTDQMSLAGFYGRLPGMLAAPAALPDPCDFSDMANLRAATAFPIQGYNAPATSPLSCIPAANHVADTDILVVRRADTSVTASASLIPEEIYIQANADPGNSANPIIAAGDITNFTLRNKDSTTIAPIRKYHVQIYFISPCSIPAGGGSVCTGGAEDNGSPIPTLKRLELRVDPTDNTLKMTTISLVEGIENLQIDYGIDTDGDGVPDGSNLSIPGTIPDWSNIMSVRLNVLARNLERSPGFTDAKTYDMGTAGTVTPGGPFKRHVYNTTVRLVNPAARREQ